MNLKFFIMDFPKPHLGKVIFPTIGYVRVPPRILKGCPVFRDIFRVPTSCHLRHSRFVIKSFYRYETEK